MHLPTRKRGLTRPLLLAAIAILVSDRHGLAGEIPGTNAPGDAVVMEIDGWPVPKDWFQHEFRSSFFRYSGSTNVRETVFGPFRNRMVLYAKARATGLDRDPALRQKIDERLAGMRAYMEYQLQMTEIDLVNEAFVQTLGIDPTNQAVDDRTLEVYYREEVSQRPGAPARLEDVPPDILDQLKREAVAYTVQQQLDRMIRDWETNMVIRVNEEAVRSVSFPVMRGTPPAGWSVE